MNGPSESEEPMHFDKLRNNQLLALRIVSIPQIQAALKSKTFNIFI